MVTTAREPRAYEIMAVFLPELADEDLTAQLDRASGYITSVGGSVKEILTDSPWGRRRLAYPIRFNGQDFRDGYYAVYHFDLEPSAMTEIERELKLDTRVMRYLVVHDDPKVGERNTSRPEAETDAPSGQETDSSAVAESAPDASTGVSSDRTSDSEAGKSAEGTSARKATAIEADNDAPGSDAPAADRPGVERTDAEPAPSGDAGESVPTGEAQASDEDPSGTTSPEAASTSGQPPINDEAPVSPADSAPDDPEQED